MASARVPKVSDSSLEVLFELVRDNECISNQRHQDHKDAVILRNIWTSIHKKLLEDNPLMNVIRPTWVFALDIDVW